MKILALWAVVVPLVLGVFLVVESLTFGRWRFGCWLFGLSRVVGISHECRMTSLTKDDEPLKICSSTEDLRKYAGPLDLLKTTEPFSNSAHLYPGASLLTVACLNAVVYWSSVSLYKSLLRPTQIFMLIVLSSLIFINIVVSETGISDIVGCKPNVNHDYTAAETSTMIVLALGLLVTFYVPVIYEMQP